MFKRLLAGALTLALSLSPVLPVASAASAAPAGALSAPVIQLGTYYTKQMNYFALGDARIPADGWVTDASMASKSGLLPFDLPENVISSLGIGSDVTIALTDADGTYWVALGEKGFMRINFFEKDARDIFQYFCGPRYIYNGTSPQRNTVTAMKSDGAHGLWVKNSLGAVHIRMIPRTLGQRAAINDQINDKLTTFRGTIIDTNVRPFDKGNDSSDGAPAAETALNASYGSEWATITEPDGSVRKFQQIEKYGFNNDSYWTGFSLIGAGNQYESLRKKAGAEDAAEAARKRIVEGAKNIMLISKIAGLGDGFMPRNYKFTTEPGGGVAGKITYRLTKKAGGDPTKIEAGDTYVVQGTGNMSGKWSGAQTLTYSFPVESYFGDGQPVFSMDPAVAIAAGSPGYMLYKDIFAGDAAIVASRGDRKVYMPYVRKDTPVYRDDINGNPVLQPDRAADWAFSYTVTENVSDKYPELVKKFTVADPVNPTRPGYAPNPDMGNLTFYTDTSSEEPTGAFASYFVLYNYVLKPELADPTTPAARRAEDLELLRILRDSAAATLNHIIDNGYVLRDPDGRPSFWGKWNRDYFNIDNRPDLDGVQAHLFIPDGTLNSSEMFMFVRVTLDILEGVKNDATTPTGINMSAAPYKLTAAPDGSASYKSCYDKFSGEYAKMKDTLEPDAKMSEFTDIQRATGTDENGKSVGDKNGRGYLKIMQQFNLRQKTSIKFWMDDIDAALADISANGGVVSLAAAQKYYTSKEYFGESKADMAGILDDLKVIRRDYQNAYDHNAYAITCNYSDALMYFVTYFPLFVLTKDEADVFSQVKSAYAQIYEGQLKPEQIPFDGYLMKLFDPAHPGIDKDLADVTRQLIRQPQYLQNFNGQQAYNAVYRKDFFTFSAYDWLDVNINSATAAGITFDERRSSKFNTNVMEIDGRASDTVISRFTAGSENTNYDGNIYMYDPSPFNVGYWVGINYNIISE